MAGGVQWGDKSKENNVLTFPFFFCTAILPKSTNAKHLSENVDVFKFNLSAEDVEAMDRLTNGTHFCWNPERVVWSRGIE